MYFGLSTISQLIPASASLLYFCFVIFGFFQYKKKDFYWTFQLYVVLLAVWSFCSFMMRSGSSIMTPLFWNRIMLIGMLSTPFALVHSIVDTIGIRSFLIRRIARISYVLIIPLMYLNFTGRVVSSASFEDGMFIYQLGSGSFAAYLTSYLYLLFMIVLMFKELRRQEYSSRTKALFRMYMLGLGIMLGGILLNLDEEIGKYPFDILASMINAMILFYGVYRYRLISYTKIGFKILSIALLLVVTSLVFFIVLLLASPMVPFVTNENKIILSLLMGSVTVIIVYPIRYAAAMLIDLVIIPKRHPYQQKIREFSQKLNTIIDLDTLGTQVVQSLTSGIHVDWAVCFVRSYRGSASDNKFILLSTYGYDGPVKVNDTVEISVSEQTAAQIEGMKRESASRLLVSRDSYGGYHFHRDFPEANMLIPLIFKGEVNGYIAIGAPWESKIYSQYEQEALEILAGQCSLSVNNALSFERIKAQGKELIISNTKLESIFNGIGTPLALTDIDFSIIEVNNAAVTFIGRRREDIIGEKCYKLFFSCSKACSFCRAPESLRIGHRAEGEAVVEGRTYSLQFHPVKILHNSRQVFLEIIQDVSEEKKMQEELMVSAKMAEIGSLAAGITHDLNNPLYGITGTAELMMTKLEKDSPHLEYLQDILQYSQSAVDVVREISLYARDEQRDADRDSIGVIDALEFSLKLAARGIDFSEIEIVRNYIDSPSVRINSGELQQVYLNIIMNAVQAMGGKGVLTLMVQESYGVVYITISDTGPGIPKEHLNQVFTPFYTTKNPGEGTGLGLSNCFRIVNKYFGRISVESEEGKGASFTIFFPSQETSSEQVRFVLAEKQHHINDVFYIQRKVLIGEKGYIEETIHRNVDNKAVHLLAYKGVNPVGTVSLVMTKDVSPLPVQAYFDAEKYYEDKEHAGEIIRLAVVPEMRNTLVSLGLVSLIFLYGRSKGMREVVIDCFSNDVKNIEMYKKFGFEIIGEYTSPSPVTVMIQRYGTPHERDAEKRSRFLAPMFRRLYTMFDFGSSQQSVIEEMQKIIPEIGRESGNGKAE